MKIELRNYIVPTIPIAVLLMIVVAVIWFSDLFISNGIKEIPDNELIVGGLQQFFGGNRLLPNILSMLITALNAFLLSQLNNKFTIIRTRSFLPILFFVLLMACWHETHLAILSHLTLTLMLLSMFVIFSVYRDRTASEQAFLSSFLIALASLLFEPLILFIPLIWVGLILFHSFSLRNFLATIIGALAPWLLYIAVRYYFQPDLSWLFEMPASFELGFPILSRPLNEIIYVVCLFIVLVMGIAGLTSNINQDSMQTRSLIYFYIWLLVLSFLFSMIFKHYYMLFMPFVGLSYAILLSHPLTLKKTNFYGYVFVGFIVVNLAFVISNIILLPK